MTAKRKQELLIALSIFLGLCSIGFSFEGTTFFWFWQEYPIIPVLLLLFAFFAIRYWLKLEIEKQRQDILAEYTRNNEISEQTNFINLLSPREIEVLDLINNSGLSNKEIAENLFVSLSTVKTHINNIYKILEVKNRREAIEKLNGK
jgi:DNA-binding CsgD family transcriptional regulator